MGEEKKGFFGGHEINFRPSNNGGLLVQVGCKILVYAAGEEKKLLSDFTLFLGEGERAAREKILGENVDEGCALGRPEPATMTSRY